MKAKNSNRMIVLTIVLAALGVLSALLMTGCTQQTPETVVEKFFGNLYAGDSGGAQKYCTTRAMEQTLDNGDNAFNTLRDDHTSGDNVYVASKLVSDVRGSTAEVWSRDDEDIRLILIKANGVWRIDEFQIPTTSTNTRTRNNDEADNNNNDEDEAETETDNNTNRRLRNDD